MIADNGLRESLRTLKLSGMLEQGLVSVAAPVRDHTGAVVAALASSTSSARSTPGHLEKNVVPLLLETAASISTDLGHRRISNTHNAETRDGFF